MKTLTSISGGKSSAYIASNYPTDYNVFALVTTMDKACTFPDAKLRQVVSDKIGREFVGTLEEDTIVHTILDLEQYLGRPIHWVVGLPFEQVIAERGGYLPNKMTRYCTTEMKMQPIFEWWVENIGEPVETQIGFRAGEERRANKMLDKCNADGLVEMHTVVGTLKDGRNKWGDVPWQKPVFPMIRDGVHRDKVHEFWKGKPVRFAERNNCVGCFHRNPILLNLMFQKHPEKMEWFARQEEVEGNGRWRSDTTYRKIQKHKTQLSLLDLDSFGECEDGYCGI